MRRIVIMVPLVLSASSVAFAQTSETPSPWSQADQYYDPAEMAAARDQAKLEMGGMKTSYFGFDRLELQSSDEGDTALWDANAWYGGDINKLWIKSEGEYAFDPNAFEDAEIQALWSHAFAAFWDVQAGIRQDFEPRGRTHAVLGVQGLAPYRFEIDAAAFLSTQGDLTARVETEYDFHLSQRLILQPRAEFEFAASEIPELETGAGLTRASVGLRLRYDIRREFAPYLGVEWRGSLGDTADMARASGVEPSETIAVVGLRAWW